MTRAADDNRGPREARTENRDEDRNPRKQRVPLGTPRSHLTAETREGYHRHWINDKPGRLELAIDGGYEFVKDKNGKVGEHGNLGSHDLGSMVSRIVGTNEGGTPLRAYLMEIKQEWRDEDVKAKLSIAYEIDNQIRNGQAGDDGNEYGNDHRYVPEEGINYKT